MPLRLTEQQYLELLQHQKDQEYEGGRPKETRERGHDGPAPKDPPPDVTPLITDLGEEWNRSKKWVPLLVVMMIPGVMPIVIIVCLFALFLAVAPFGGLAEKGTYLIARTQGWYDLMIRAGLNIGPGWCTLIAAVIFVALYMYYRHTTNK